MPNSVVFLRLLSTMTFFLLMHHWELGGLYQQYSTACAALSSWKQKVSSLTLGLIVIYVLTTISSPMPNDQDKNLVLSGMYALARVWRAHTHTSA